MDSDKLLGEFLRARRESTTPRQVGLPFRGSRRTPGLRREEVAALSGVSTAYYVRLEQGRERNPSDQVLDALARVLRLDRDERIRSTQLAALQIQHKIFELKRQGAPERPLATRRDFSASIDNQG